MRAHRRASRRHYEAVLEAVLGKNLLPHRHVVVVPLRCLAVVTRQRDKGPTASTTKTLAKAAVWSERPEKFNAAGHENGPPSSPKLIESSKGHVVCCFLWASSGLRLPCFCKSGSVESAQNRRCRPITVSSHSHVIGC